MVGGMTSFPAYQSSSWSRVLKLLCIITVFSHEHILVCVNSHVAGILDTQYYKGREPSSKTDGAHGSPD